MELKYFFRPKLIRRVTSVNHYTMKRGFIQAEHNHASYGHEIIYLDYGVLELLLNNQPVHLNPGEIIFIRGRTPHSFKGHDELPFDYLNIMFRGELPDYIFNHPLRVDRKMRDILQQLKHELDFQEKNYLEMTGALLTELTVSLIRQTQRGDLSKEIPLPANRLQYESEVVEKALNIIRKYYNTPLRADNVAKAIQVSASHMRLLLRKNTGKNFITLLHEYRVKAAKHYIRSTGKTFSKISAEVGFESPAFFFKIFKRHTAMTPKAYAQSLM